jgi:DNA-binding protein H-NS
MKRYTFMIAGTVMMSALRSMTSDELFELHQKIGTVLSARLVAKKNALERRLRQLTQFSDSQASTRSKSRQPYPAVIPKFRNPDRPSETWSGRGKQPRWLSAQLSAGKRIDDFRIDPAAT